jgi:hypothetical protein
MFAHEVTILNKFVYFMKRDSSLSLRPWNGWAQDAPLKGAGISNIDYMNVEVALR